MAISNHLDYEYMNEDDIDEELKCIICQQPLQIPVSLPICNHTFCKECIETWLHERRTCPTCRKVISNDPQQYSAFYRPMKTTAYVEINTRIVLNQLDRLLVRCLLCGEDNIQRCNYKNHEKNCSKKIVLCPAADIKCSWKGTRSELPTHLNNCSFQQVRPIIDELKTELKLTKLELKNSVDSFNKKFNFLLQLINKGNLMTEECTMPMTECKYRITDTSNNRMRFTCNICNKSIQHKQISFHACSGGCICLSCARIQYSNDFNRSDELFYNDFQEDSWD